MQVTMSGEINASHGTRPQQGFAIVNAKLLADQFIHFCRQRRFRAGGHDQFTRLRNYAQQRRITCLTNVERTATTGAGQSVLVGFKPKLARWTKRCREQSRVEAWWSSRFGHVGGIRNLWVCRQDQSLQSLTILSRALGCVNCFRTGHCD